MLNGPELHLASSSLRLATIHEFVFSETKPSFHGIASTSNPTAILLTKRPLHTALPNGSDARSAAPDGSWNMLLSLPKRVLGSPKSFLRFAVLPRLLLRHLSESCPLNPKSLLQTCWHPYRCPPHPTILMLTSMSLVRWVLMLDIGALKLV